MQLDGLADRLQARLARGRAAAQARMLSRVAVMRKTGYAEQDEATGREATEWATVYPDLPFRLDQAGATSGSSGSSTEKEIAGARLQLGSDIGHLPYDTLDLRDGDLLEITAGTWLASVWRIVDASMGDQQTARRVRLEETQRPTEWEA